MVFPSIECQGLQQLNHQPLTPVLVVSRWPLPPKACISLDFVSCETGTLKSEIPECMSELGPIDRFSIFQKCLQHVSKQQGSLQISKRKVTSSLDEKEKISFNEKRGWVLGPGVDILGICDQTNSGDLDV